MDHSSPQQRTVRLSGLPQVLLRCDIPARVIDATTGRPPASARPRTKPAPQPIEPITNSISSSAFNNNHQTFQPYHNHQQLSRPRVKPRLFTNPPSQRTSILHQQPTGSAVPISTATVEPTTVVPKQPKINSTNFQQSERFHQAQSQEQYHINNQQQQRQQHQHQQQQQQHQQQQHQHQHQEQDDPYNLQQDQLYSQRGPINNRSCTPNILHPSQNIKFASPPQQIQRRAVSSSPAPVQDPSIEEIRLQLKTLSEQVSSLVTIYKQNSQIQASQIHAQPSYQAQQAHHFQPPSQSEYPPYQSFKTSINHSSQCHQNLCHQYHPITRKHVEPEEEDALADISIASKEYFRRYDLV